MLITKTITAFTIRPVSTAGTISATHMFLVGVGLFTESADTKKTVIYKNIVGLLPSKFIGLLMILTALGLIYGFFSQKDKFVNTASLIQSSIWLFVSFLYFADSDYLLMFSNGLVWVAFSLTNAYAYENRELWWSGEGTRFDKRASN